MDKRVLLLAMPLLLSALLLGSCAGGQALKTRDAATIMEGDYTLILHGCNYGNDPETVAFLSREASPYPLQPYSPPFQYRVHSGLSARTALAQAREFIVCSAHYSHARLQAISDPAGAISGYELRPLYHLGFFRHSDLLDISYRLENERVMIYLTPIALEDDPNEQE